MLDKALRNDLRHCLSGLSRANCRPLVRPIESAVTTSRRSAGVSLSSASGSADDSGDLEQIKNAIDPKPPRRVTQKCARFRRVLLRCFKQPALI
jgi:hypothetical protein